MANNLTGSELAILQLLLVAVQEIEELAKRPWAATWRQRCRLGDWNLGHGVRVDGEWVGYSAADRQKRIRILASLETKGMIQRTAPTERYRTHAVLTPEGRAVAEQYAPCFEGETAP